MREGQQAVCQAQVPTSPHYLNFFLILSQNGPELLPRVAMLRLLTWVIGTGSPRLQVIRFPVGLDCGFL